MKDGAQHTVYGKFTELSERGESHRTDDIYDKLVKNTTNFKVKQRLETEGPFHKKTNVQKQRIEGVSPISIEHRMAN